MRPIASSRPFHCVSCEIEIVRQPVFHVGLPFCCGGCVAGGPCVCSYDDEPEEAARPEPAAAPKRPILSR